jgi:hypothetical protein
MFNVMKKNKRESATVREREREREFFGGFTGAACCYVYIRRGKTLQRVCVYRANGRGANFHQAKYLITPLSSSFAKIPIAEAKYLHTRQQQTSW